MLDVRETILPWSSYLGVRFAAYERMDFPRIRAKLHDLTGFFLETVPTIERDDW